LKINRLGTKVFITITLLISAQLISINPFYINIVAQTSLIEEDDYFLMYASNQYDIEISKSNELQNHFNIQGLGTIETSFIKISEYSSDGIFLTSLNDLNGKSYDLSKIDWSFQGIKDVNRICVNATRNKLANSANLINSVTIFNANTTINEYEIAGIIQTLQEFQINNWTFSEDNSGICINLQASLLNEDYLRFGPYFNSKEKNYQAEILTENENIFYITFQPEIEIITMDGEKITTEVHPFANYNVAEYTNKKLDFWLSIPITESYSSIIIRLVYSFNIQSNETGLGFVLMNIVCSIAITVLLINQKKRKRKAQ
jgi:hypothetical protein